MGHQRRRALRHRLYEPRARYGHQLADASLFRLGRQAYGRYGNPAGKGATSPAARPPLGHPLHRTSEGPGKDYRPTNRIRLVTTGDVVMLLREAIQNYHELLTD